MKKILKILLLVILIVIAYFIIAIYPKFDIISGFSSKSIASHLFIAGRDQAFTEKTDNDIESMDLAKNTVNLSKKSVSTTVYGLKKRTAVFKKGLGVILLPENVQSFQTAYVPKRSLKPKNLPYPYGNLPQKDTLFQNIDYKKLAVAIDNAFIKEPEIKKTRAVVVIYKDYIVAEKYKQGFDKNSMFLGWSMTKSITSAVLGVLEKQQKITLNQTNLFKEWENDNRKNITLKNLLNMNSGLAWVEDYTKISDVTKMLFVDGDMSKTQLKKQFVGKPNESWNYSSGTTNLLSRFIRNQFTSQQAYLDFWYDELIDKIGMHSMLIEPDFSGNYVGSSYGWATARDWGKFGLLYLHNGNWNGEQILNKSWIDFTRKPTNTSKGIYGGHFWLNTSGDFLDVPKNMYYADGYQGQFVYIFPDKDLVIVRTGLDGNKKHLNILLKEILDAFEF